MRTLRLTLTATVILTLLGGSGNVVVAQPEETERPDAASAVVIVTGTHTVEGCTLADWGRYSEEPSVYRWRDITGECQVTASDPRVSGTNSFVENQDLWWAGTGMSWGTARLEGPDGGWDCTSTRIHGVHPSAPLDGIGLHVCPGDGDYEGLTYVFYTAGMDEESSDEPNVFGFIYPGEPPPPWGPPVEPPAE